MALKHVCQREIVEVPFVLPGGVIIPHPALVISCNDLQIVEPGLFYAILVSSKNIHPTLTIPILKEWLSSPLPKASYFVTHIISAFNVDDVISRHNCFLRQPYFDRVIDRIVSVVVDGEW